MTALLCVGVFSLPVIATAVDVPNSFESGDLVTASAMNENFEALANAITALEGNHSAAAVQSPSSGNFVTSSETWEPIDNLEITVESSGGPIAVALVGAAAQTSNYRIVSSSGASVIGMIEVQRQLEGAVDFETFATTMVTLGAAGAIEMPISGSFLDVPPAGGHTYRVRARVGSAAGGQEFHINHARLVAHGLPH